MKRLAYVALLLLGFALPQLSHAALTTNLVSYYQFEGNANDSTGTRNGGVNSVSFGSSYGKILQGAHFNTSGNRVDLGSSSIYNNSAFTVAVWVNTPWTGVTRDTIFSTDDTWQYGRGFNLSLNDGNQIGILMGGSFTNKAVVSSASTYITPNVWHHIVVTYDGSTLTGYIDGVSRGTVASGYNSAAGSALIGLRGDMTDYWKGNMDEFGYWSRALSSAEVSQLYNGGAGLTYPFVSAPKFAPWQFTSF